MIGLTPLRIGLDARPSRTQSASKAPNASETAFRAEMEVHLANNRNGQAYLSENTHAELGRRHRENVSSLGQLDPVSEAKYLVTMSALNYDGQARLAASMHTTQQAVSKIYRAHEFGSEYASELDKIVNSTEAGSSERREALVSLNQQFAQSVNGG